MVNYCCVYGCGRNSRSHGHLIFYTLPKDKPRQTAWLKAACPEVLGSKLDEKSLKSRRVCSRHFAPSCMRNQRLGPDAVPTLCLNEDEQAEADLPEQHPGLACNECSNAIIGYRYACTECRDYDLCQRCEAHGTHAAHCMLRLPKPVEYVRETVKTLIKQFSMSGKPNQNARSPSPVVKEDPIIWDSSDDDEPITAFRSAGVDLPESVKSKIRDEVKKAIVRASQVTEHVPVETKTAKRPVKRPKSKPKPAEESQVNDEVEIVLGHDLPIEYVTEQTSGGDYTQKCSDDEIMETSRDNRQSNIDIEMNDTLSEFLIKRV